MFAWLRKKVFNAVLSGIADAADYLDQQRPQQEEVDPALRLEERLRLLPAPVEDEAPKRRRNG